MVCVLDVVCFAVSCCPAGGISPFYSAHWRLLLLQTVVTRQGRNAILLCTLDIACFAVSCCPAVAYRHFILRTGGYLLCGLLLFSSGGTPFCFAHWTLFASRSLVVRQWRNAILVCALDIVCFAIPCNSAIGGAPGVHESQRTCESLEYPICKNKKQPPVECMN